MRTQDTGVSVLAGGRRRGRAIALVDSSVLRAMEYDAERQELTLLFKESGERYRYLEVPEAVWRGLQAAESKGTFLNEVLKPMGFRYRRVGRRG